MRSFKPLALVLAVALLVSCASAKPATSGLPSTTTPAGVVQSAVGTSQAPGQASAGTTQPADQTQGLTRTDGQGAVTVEVTPENLNNPGNLLTFDIGMDTHSVDLNMDLATLATLTTDNGRAVQATEWKGPGGGGHHVSGKLSFPTSVNGGPLLEGAKKLTLSIRNVDAAERVFVWDLAN